MQLKENRGVESRTFKSQAESTSNRSVYTLNIEQLLSAKMAGYDVTGNFTHRHVTSRPVTEIITTV